jgi:hypothetical protein
MNKYRDSLEAHFERAAQSGFAPFPLGVPESDPLNSTPFFCSFGDFCRLAEVSHQRLEILNSAKWLIRDSLENDLDVLLLMVGGSFLDISNLAPNDLDCVIFYKLRDGALSIPTEWMSSIRGRAKEKRIDARFVPADANFLVLIRSALYFAALYGEAKAGSSRRGVLLVDCSDIERFLSVTAVK